MIVTDYSHAGQPAEIEALDVIEQRAEKGEIPVSVARKIGDRSTEKLPERFRIRAETCELLNAENCARFKLCGRLRFLMMR